MCCTQIGIPHEQIKAQKVKYLIYNHTDDKQQKKYLNPGRLTSEPILFFCKGSDNKYFCFLGHMVSVTSTQLYNVKATLNNTKTNGHTCLSIKLYSQKQVACLLWLMSYSLLIPALKQSFQSFGISLNIFQKIKMRLLLFEVKNLLQL